MNEGLSELDGKELVEKLQLDVFLNEFHIGDMVSTSGNDDDVWEISYIEDVDSSKGPVCYLKKNYPGISESIVAKLYGTELNHIKKINCGAKPDAKLVEMLVGLMLRQGDKLRAALGLNEKTAEEKLSEGDKVGFIKRVPVAATRPFYYRIPNDSRCFILVSCLPSEYLHALAGNETIEFDVDGEAVRFKYGLNHTELTEEDENSINELIKVVLKFKVSNCKVSDYDIKNLLNLKDRRVEEIYKELVTVRDLFCKRNVELLESCVLDLIDFGNDITVKEDNDEYRSIIFNLKDFFEKRGAPESLLAKIECGYLSK